ncbi:galactosyl transferase GMA12/MNN10 family-domain-containing protein [Phaeosphaeria sp. MPI-PUGE-AT-0046c]|nr:galactosyl transferase GMA12/MNN10 family-domain-containing protein [Phaeosphaeria sp. MPI-PUGE-AT-0046c]
MLLRSFKVPPSLLLLILFLAFFGWQLSQGTKHEEGPVDSEVIPLEEGERRSPRIAIMTFVTEQRSYLHQVLKNKDHYARRHGYDLIVDYEQHNDVVMFWKFDMAERLIKSGKYDWLWWMDFDTLITNTDTKVTDVIDEELKNVTNPDEIDYLITHDCNGFNGGSFIVRSHDRSLKFLHDSRDIHDRAKEADIQMSEQDSIVKLLTEDTEAAARTHVMPQWKLNAFPQEIACFDDDKKVWEHGTFVLHFAGAWAHVKGEDPTGQLMKKYEHQVIWGDWKDFY